MNQHLRGVWLKDKIQNLIMLLRYNKDSLVVEDFENKDWSLILDCGIWYVKEWRYNKIGHKGIIDIVFQNGKTISISYYGEKYKYFSYTDKPKVVITMNALLEKIINEKN